MKYVWLLTFLGLLSIVWAVEKKLHPPMLARTYAHDTSKLSPVVRLTDHAGRTFCSGVVITPHTIITAGHCVLDPISYEVGHAVFADDIYIRDVDANTPGIKAEVVKFAAQLDTAVLTGEFGEYESRPYITSVDKLVEVAQPGVDFISCGYPLGGEIFCTKLKYLGRINFMWLVKGTLLPGMSGGPTMLDDGTVIAINDAVQGDFSIVEPIFNVPVIP